MTRQPQIRQGFYPIFLYYRLLQKIIFSFFATIAQVAIHIFIIITEHLSTESSSFNKN
jgi:hypothetical protein